VPGVAGGICQVSTTLYNAVLRAGLEIIERHPHSQPVDYVPPGLDATVSDEAGLDLRFRNQLDVPVTIGACMEGPRLIAGGKSRSFHPEKCTDSD
jgi:vancomycin resistance protein YoaR